jgi:alpha-aminoadipate carrier protein LysW
VTAPCPECRNTVEIPPDAAEGELLVCGRCGVELEILALDPVKLALFEEEEK